MREFMQIINEHIDVDRNWIIEKMIAAVQNDDHWDSAAMRRDDQGKLVSWGMGTDDRYDMAGNWSHDLGMSGVSPREIAETEPFKARLRAWANARYDEVIKKISHLMHGDDIPAHRMIRIPMSWFDEIKAKGQASVGIYWSFDYDTWEDPYAIWGGDQEGNEILISALIPQAAVDWHYTILANMDWMQGDREQELRIKFGAPIKVTKITVDNESIPVEGVRFTG